MKKGMLFLAAALCSAPLWVHAAEAAQTGAGGYTGPGPAVVTVTQAKDMKDDAPVTLQGHIEKRLGGDKYQFRDGTGDITVEIDDRVWKGQQISAIDKVEIQGEVDREWSNLEIDVASLIKK